MKQKIKEALRQEYKSRLELDDERLDGVAAFASTFITDEAKVEEFVKNEATLAMLKSYQSVVDKDRAKRNAKYDQTAPTEPATPAEHQPAPVAPQPEDMVKIIAEAVATAIQPLSDEITKFKGEQTAKAALESAKAQFFGNDYVKKYGDEATDAWEVAMIEYKYNTEWTAEQINETAMGRFNKAVGKRGVDTSKPLPSEGGGNAKADFTGLAQRLREKNMLPSESNN